MADVWRLQLTTIPWPSASPSIPVTNNMRQSQWTTHAHPRLLPQHSESTCWHKLTAFRPCWTSSSQRSKHPWKKDPIKNIFTSSMWNQDMPRNTTRYRALTFKSIDNIWCDLTFVKSWVTVFGLVYLYLRYWIVPMNANIRRTIDLEWRRVGKLGGLVYR